MSGFNPIPRNAKEITMPFTSEPLETVAISSDVAQALDFWESIVDSRGYVTLPRVTVLARIDMLKAQVEAAQ